MAKPPERKDNGEESAVQDIDVDTDNSKRFKSLASRLIGVSREELAAREREYEKRKIVKSNSK